MAGTSRVSSSLPISKLINNGTDDSTSVDELRTRRCESQVSSARARFFNCSPRRCRIRIRSTPWTIPSRSPSSLNSLRCRPATISKRRLRTSSRTSRFCSRPTRRRHRFGRNGGCRRQLVDGTGTVWDITVVNGKPMFTLVDSNGNVLTDANGNPLKFPTSQISVLNRPWTQYATASKSRRRSHPYDRKVRPYRSLPPLGRGSGTYCARRLRQVNRSKSPRTRCSVFNRATSPSATTTWTA